MERRQRPRIVPEKEMAALFAGARSPARVLDFSATGMAVELNKNQMFLSRRCAVDIMMAEKLCACDVPGVIRWMNCDVAGISFTPRNECQMKAMLDVELSMMCM